MPDRWHGFSSNCHPISRHVTDFLAVCHLLAALSFVCHSFHVCLTRPQWWNINTGCISLLSKTQLSSPLFKMPGGLTILRDGRNVFQSSLSRDNLPSLRPGFLATDRVVYTFYEPIFNQRMTDEDVEEKLVGGMANKDDFPNSKAHFEEIMVWVVSRLTLKLRFEDLSNTR